MFDNSTKEFVCLLIGNEENKFYLTDVKDRGLWLPFEERNEQSSHYTLRGLAIKIVEQVKIKLLLQFSF